MIHPEPSKETCLDYSAPDKSSKGWGNYQEYTQYSPSSLIVSDSSSRLFALKQWLECRGCHVKGVNIHHSGKLASVSKQYFDMMVVDLESFEQTESETQADLLAAIQKLKAYPGLSSLPTIILTNCTRLRMLINRSVAGSVYCLTRDTSTEASLLQIMAQIHYLTYRYI
jgi:CheY-like chemotaxis protein